MTKQVQSTDAVKPMVRFAQPDRDPAPGMRWTKNLMSGKFIEIPIDTPRSCDPGTELYWSM